MASPLKFIQEDLHTQIYLEMFLWAEYHAACTPVLLDR